LAGKGRAIGLSDDRIRLICETARTLGYRPNALARGMRAGKFGSVALVLSAKPGRSYLPQHTLYGISEALAEQELHLTVAELPDEKLTDAGFVPKILREWCCDAMLVNYTDDIPGRMIELIEALRQPAIWLNRKQEHDCVYPDDVAMGRQAAQRLLAAGHRRIAYLDWGAGWKQLDTAHYSQRDRQEGYVEAMKAAGLTPQPIRREDSDVKTNWRELCEMLTRLLAGDDRPTAFVTYSTPFARRIATAASRRGLGLPADLSIVNTGNADSIDLDDGREISTVVAPEHAYGAAGVEAVLEKLEAPGGTRVPPRAVPPEQYYEGQTVAPPPRPAKRQMAQ
jgi:LacI family transcriptional regulator